MAAFCEKCGNPVDAGTAVCTRCGTPVNLGAGMPLAGGAAPPPPPPPAPAYAPVAPAAGYGAAPRAAGYPPAAGYAGAAPASGGGRTVKVILIVVAVVVGMGVLALGGIGVMGWMVMRSLHVKGKDGVTLSVPGGGTLTAGTTTAGAAELGVPIYPGATRQKGGVQMSTSAGSMTMAHFATGDSVSTVADFYKGKLPEGAATISTGSSEGMVLSSGGAGNDQITITVGKGSGEDAGKTTIVIMRTKKK